MMMREIDRSLRIAAAEGDVAKVKQLVRKGADINAGASTGSPLLIAIGQSSLDVVECLIDRGASVNLPDARDGIMPLHLATLLGRVDVALLLIKHRALVDAKRKKDGSTPLIMAVERANVDMVDLLLRAGADITETKSTNGFSALHAACCGWRHAELVHKKEAPALLQEDGDQSQEEVYLYMVSLILDKAFSVGGSVGVDAAIAAQANCGLTPLHMACKHGHATIVQMLIQSRFPTKLIIIDDEIGKKHCHFSLVWEVCKRIAKSVFSESKNRPKIKTPSSPDWTVPLLMADVNEHEISVCH